MSRSPANSARPFEPPMPDPLAYFLTWTTYGSWLPGDERGWILKGHGIQMPNPVRQKFAESLLTEPPCALNDEQRNLVEATIGKHCGIRGWQLHAVNCRTNHVHVVVSADCEPETVREQFKAWCTRKLKEHQHERFSTFVQCTSEGIDSQLGSSEVQLRENWWTERGSIRKIGDEESLEAAIIYVKEGQ